MDFGTLKARVVRMLGDIVTGGAEASVSGPSGPYTLIGGTLYDAEVVADGIRAALIAVTSRQWKVADCIVTGSATMLSTDVPDSLLEFEGIYDLHIKQFIPRIPFKVDGTQYDTWANAWYVFPTGTITFLNEIVDGVRIYYSTYWTVPEYDDDKLETPTFLENALVYYAASQCALTKSGQTAAIRQFNTKVDSGNPDDNPLLQQSNSLLRRYEREMSIIPMMVHNNVEHRTGGTH